MSVRQEKVAELLKKIASEYVMRESNASSLITITRVDISPNLRGAIIFFTVLPEDKEHEAVEFLKRKEYDFKGYVLKKAALKYVPNISFELDLGEKNRILIEELSKNI